MVLTLENHLASVALLKKATTKGLDRSIEIRARFSFFEGSPPPAETRAADWPEYDLYISEYLGYADAMTAVAKRRNQSMAFFWEYFLGHLGGVKPFSKVEEKLYLPNRLPNYEQDRAFDFYARDRVSEYFPRNGVSFIDPLEDLKRFDGTVFIDYLHYTKEGNEFMARVMYQQLRNVLHDRAQRIKQDNLGAASAPGTQRETPGIPGR